MSSKYEVIQSVDDVVNGGIYQPPGTLQTMLKPFHIGLGKAEHNLIRLSFLPFFVFFAAATSSLPSFFLFSQRFMMPW